MTAAQILGYALMALPFILIGGYSWRVLGFLTTVGIFAATAAIVASVIVGTHLAMGGGLAAFDDAEIDRLVKLNDPRRTA